MIKNSDQNAFGRDERKEIMTQDPQGEESNETLLSIVVAISHGQLLHF